MRAGSLFLFIILLMNLILLIGCGDEYIGPDYPDQGCTMGFGIHNPTSQATWDTQESSVDLGGAVEPPGGIGSSSDCPLGDPGYNIFWYNADSSAGGIGGAWTYLNPGGFFGPYCDTLWTADNVPLNVGDNHITVTVRNAQGCTGQASILIGRSAEESNR